MRTRQLGTEQGHPGLSQGLYPPSRPRETACRSLMPVGIPRDAQVKRFASLSMRRRPGHPGKTHDCRSFEESSAEASVSIEACLTKETLALRYLKRAIGAI